MLHQLAHSGNRSRTPIGAAFRITDVIKTLIGHTSTSARSAVSGDIALQDNGDGRFCSNAVTDLNSVAERVAAVDSASMLNVCVGCHRLLEHGWPSPSHSSLAQGVSHNNLAVNKPSHDARKGVMRKRSRLKAKNEGEEHWTKRSCASGQSMDQKKIRSLKKF